MNATFRNGALGATTPSQSYSDTTPLGDGGLFPDRTGADVIDPSTHSIYYFGHGAGNPQHASACCPMPVRAAQRKLHAQADHHRSTGRNERNEMRKFFEIGGVIAAFTLIAFGIGALALGINGRSTVRDSLKLEQIVGSDDMTPALIAADARKAGLSADVPLPTVNIAGKQINTGDRALAFASYMRIHTLESTGGLTYSQMGRFATADGAPAGTSDETVALKDADGQPIANGARNIWVTETALTTALNTSYMAEKTALFGIVVGIALLLSGLGFGILAIGGALRNADRSVSFGKRDPKTTATPVTVA